MPLVSENSLLENAEKGKYAIPGLFPFDMNFIKVFIEAAEEARSPIIILQGPEVTKLFGAPMFSSALITAARNAKVPVCISADHAIKIDEKTLNDVLMFIQYGWKSIMVDGSLLSYEENVSKTKEITRICHAAGIACCGALGEVKRFFPVFKESFKEGYVVPDELMTDSQQAKDFVERTGVDSLAVSIGQYVRSLIGEENLDIKRTVRLDLDRLKAIRKATPAHLILQGSSHVNKDDLQKSIEYGISEIKFASAYGTVWAANIKETVQKTTGLFHPMDIQKPALKKVKENIIEYMRLFKSFGKA